MDNSPKPLRRVDIKALLRDPQQRAKLLAAALRFFRRAKKLF